MRIVFEDKALLGVIGDISRIIVQYGEGRTKYYDAEENSEFEASVSFDEKGREKICLFRTFSSTQKIRNPLYIMREYISENPIGGMVLGVSIEQLDEMIEATNQKIIKMASEWDYSEIEPDNINVNTSEFVRMHGKLVCASFGREGGEDGRYSVSIFWSYLDE